jgi:hypothetical protein
VRHLANRVNRPVQVLRVLRLEIHLMARRDIQKEKWCLVPDWQAHISWTLERFVGRSWKAETPTASLSRLSLYSTKIPYINYAQDKNYPA